MTKAEERKLREELEHLRRSGSELLTALTTVSTERDALGVQCRNLKEDARIASRKLDDARKMERDAAILARDELSGILALARQLTDRIEAEGGHGYSVHGLAKAAADALRSHAAKAKVGL